MPGKAETPRRDAKGAEICLFDYPRGLRPSCLDDFVHLRLNPFEQDSQVEGAEDALEKLGRGEREGRFEYSIKTDLSRRGNNYLLRAEDTFEVIVTEATEFR